MLQLVIPEEKYLKSYMEAYEEYASMGTSTFGLSDARTVDIFVKFEDYRMARNLKPDRVGSDIYWLVDDERAYFIGEIHIRHRLNEALKLRGGHIGYVIRYGEWNRGYATYMLSLALAKAAQRGLSEVLITCNDTNAASARVMEKNGCTLIDKVTVDGIPVRRYRKAL